MHAYMWVTHGPVGTYVVMVTIVEELFLSLVQDSIHLYSWKKECRILWNISSLDMSYMCYMRKSPYLDHKYLHTPTIGLHTNSIAMNNVNL